LFPKGNQGTGVRLGALKPGLNPHWQSPLTIPRWSPYLFPIFMYVSWSCVSFMLFKLKNPCPPLYFLFGLRACACMTLFVLLVVYVVSPAQSSIHMRLLDTDHQKYRRLHKQASCASL